MEPPPGRGGCHSVTHPSDHNSVSIDPRVRKQRHEAWKLRWQRRRGRDGQKIKNNTKGKGKTRDPEERHVTGGQEQAASEVVIPLPLMHGYGYPFESSEYPGLYVGVSTFLSIDHG